MKREYTKTSNSKIPIHLTKAPVSLRDKTLIKFLPSNILNNISFKEFNSLTLKREQ